MRTHGTLAQRVAAAEALALIVLVGLTLSACGPSPHGATPPSPKVNCWDGSAVSDAKCPEVAGPAGLEWLVPQRQSGPAAICTKRLPTDYSPVATADDILACHWPDLESERPDLQPHLEVTRYPTVELANSGCVKGEDWIVNGEVYGSTGATEGFQDERWWCYSGLPFVFEFIATAPEFYELPKQLIFRTPDEVRVGHT